MRSVKQLIAEMETSKRDEFKNLDGKFTNAWTLRLLLEIIARMDANKEQSVELSLDEMLESGGLNGIIEALRESLGESERPAGQGEGNNSNSVG